MQKVLIVGGGFGGIKAALELANNANFDVTLLSDRDAFRYYPGLYHTATGGRRVQTNIPLQELFDQTNIRIVLGTAAKLNRKSKFIKTEAGETYHFDILIMALGVVTNYFGIDGLKEYSYSIKSVEEAERLKRHIHQQLIDERKPDLNYVVIGGGPTGIELAGALPAYIHESMQRHGIKHRAVHVDLIEAMPQLLPRMPKDVSRSVRKRLRDLGVKLYLNQAVQGQTADALTVNGKPIKSHTVIWTAGVMNHPFFKSNDFELNQRGKVVVNEFLEAEHSIFVIGDNADTPYSGLAQTALHDAITVADNLIRHATGKDVRAYKAKQPVSVIPAGLGWASVVWGKLHFSGRIGWWLREAADYIAFKDLEPFWKASQQWTTEFGREDDCPICATAE